MNRETRRRLAFGLIVAGALVVAAGLVGLLAGNGGTAAAATTTAVLSPTTTAGSTSSASTASSTSAAVTSTTAFVGTTTSAAPTTTTTDVAEAVEEFGPAFAAALEAGDLDFVFDRLHPVVLASFGEDLCRAYVEREVSLIREYRIIGPVGGPGSTTFSTPEGDITVTDLYTAPVSFRFEGQEVTTEGAFAPVAGEVRWFTNCR